MVSMAHALLIGPWALYLCGQTMPGVDSDRAFGWDDRLGALHAVAAA